MCVLVSVCLGNICWGPCPKIEESCILACVTVHVRAWGRVTNMELRERERESFLLTLWGGGGGGEGRERRFKISITSW